MGAAAGRASEHLRGLGRSGHRPGRELLVSRTVLDALEAGGVSDWRSGRRRIIVSDWERAYGREIQTGLILEIGVDVGFRCVS